MCLTLLASPVRSRRSVRGIVALTFVAVVAFALGCGGGGGGAGGGSGGGGGPATTTTTFTSSTGKVAQGANFTLTGTVKSSNSSNTPTGTLTLYDSTLGFSLAAVAMANGAAQAQLTDDGSFPYVPGTHSVSAQYSGDSKNLGSHSGNLNITIIGPIPVGVSGQTSSDVHVLPITITIQ